MPASVTHCLCGEKAILQSGNTYFMKLTNKYRAAYLLGCQGPDPAYFYDGNPLRNKEKRKEFVRIGNNLHNYKVNEYFSLMLKKAKETKDEVIIAFVLGYMSHHALDVCCHPYVFSRTKTFKAHQQFEAQLDFEILRLSKLTVKEYRFDKIMCCKKEQKKKISRLMQEITQKVFDCTLTITDFKNSIDDFNTMEKLFYDPSYKKYAIVAKLEKLIGLEGKATPMMITPYDDKLDAYNYRKDKWIVPATQEVSNKDFGELFKAGVDLTIQRVHLFDQYLNFNEDETALLNNIGDKSYETALAKIAMKDLNIQIE